MAKLTINGRVHEVQVDPETPLLWVIREQIGLTGTKYGCGIAQCGACTVHIDGVPTRSCVRPASTVGAAEKVVTIFSVAATVEAGRTQERVGTPSMCTVQAPHCAMPQPYFVPCKPATSRSAHRRGMSGSALSVMALPFSVKATDM